MRRRTIPSLTLVPPLARSLALARARAHTLSLSPRTLSSRSGSFSPKITLYSPWVPLTHPMTHLMTRLGSFSPKITPYCFGYETTAPSECDLLDLSLDHLGWHCDEELFTTQPPLICGINAFCKPLLCVRPSRPGEFLN